MATTATRTTKVVFSGDIVGTQTHDAADNTLSIGIVNVLSLANGANTITVPTSGTLLPTAVTIIPPAGNTTLMTLKGVAGDSGIALHATDPSVIALKSTVTTFVITAGGAINGVRFIWS